MNFASLVRRLAVYTSGMFLLAMGVAFSIKSGLGVSPVSSLPYALSLTLQKDVGLMSAMVFTFYVLLQIILLRRKFELKNLFQLGVAFLFGFFVSFSNALILPLTPVTYPYRLTLLVISLFLIAMGIIFYLSANLIPQPPEGIVLALQSTTGIPFSKIKIIFDSTSVFFAVILLLLFVGNIQGLREGTLLAALGVGRLIGYLSRWLRPILVSFIEKPL
ncbi:MAG: hypothetical protein D5S00_03755 [Tindallia sp. MSAO_Bac2]|nr:MAG: hypothetical protein D5S00_03755 [Tindallia sp. MSAO_Bac2]